MHWLVGKQQLKSHTHENRLLRHSMQKKIIFTDRHWRERANKSNNLIRIFHSFCSFWPLLGSLRGETIPFKWWHEVSCENCWIFMFIKVRTLINMKILSFGPWLDSFNLTASWRDKQAFSCSSIKLLLQEGFISYLAWYCIQEFQRKLSVLICAFWQIQVVSFHNGG